MRLPHPIPYQGSKRNIAKYILPYFPKDIDTLIEPFAGSAAISIAAAYFRKAERFHINDINEPLMALWQEIIENPYRIAETYQKLWEQQLTNPREFYDYVRYEFNKTSNPDFLLYLLARCVKASIRYNSNGEFNQSPDNRRLGRNPKQMMEDILSVSNLLQGKTHITSMDYLTILKTARPGDLIYMDPPYQGVCSNRDSRYYSGIEYDNFIQSLEDLDKKKISFILSYDGRTGKKTYGKELPKELNLRHTVVEVGRSSQATLLGRNEITYESIYLSRALVNRLNLPTTLLEDTQLKQLYLIDPD